MIECCPVGEGPHVDLRLDVLAHDAVERLEAGHVDLVVEVADVAEDRLVLHPRHLLDGDDVLVAGRGDDDVGDVEHVVEGRDLVAVHRRLQRADRVDLGDDDAGALAAQRLRAALADVAVAADDRDLAADEDVGGAVDAVDERVAAAVLVVELRLGDRVVDVDGREEQRALLHHVVETVHAGGGLLGDALDLAGDLGPAVLALGERGVEDVEDDLLLVALGGGRVGRLAGLLGLDAEVDEQRGVATVVEDHVGERLPSGPVEDLLGAPPVLLQRLALPGEDRDALRVLGRCRSGRPRSRRPRGPGWRRCCRRPSAPRRRARPASRSARRSGSSCAASRRCGRRRAACESP